MNGFADVGPKDDLSYTGAVGLTKYTEGTVNPDGSLTPYVPGKLPATIFNMPTKNVLIGVGLLILVLYLTKRK